MFYLQWQVLVLLLFVNVSSFHHLSCLYCYFQGMEMMMQLFYLRGFTRPGFVKYIKCWMKCVWKCRTMMLHQRLFVMLCYWWCVYRDSSVFYRERICFQINPEIRGFRGQTDQVWWIFKVKLINFDQFWLPEPLITGF